MSTPALARATEALAPSKSRATKRTEYGEMSTPILLLSAKAAARTAVSAALHDPDGALARTLCRRIHRSLWPIASTPDPEQPGCSNCREHVAVLRAAILGPSS